MDILIYIIDAALPALGGIGLKCLYDLYLKVYKNNIADNIKNNKCILTLFCIFIIAANAIWIMNKDRIDSKGINLSKVDKHITYINNNLIDIRNFLSMKKYNEKDVGQVILEDGDK